jgi:two-component system, OmpR family, phosphate regulon sensor histidine kinase PhoR
MTNFADRPSQIEHDRLTSLINSMADGVLAVDRFTKVVVYNGAALNILDLNSTIQGKPLDDVLKLVDKNNQPIDAIEYVRSIKIPTVNESFRLTYQDGSAINLYLSVSPVSRSYGTHQLSGYVLVLRDITHEKSLEEERDEFISVVSHELRTPIAIAEGNISNAQFIADKTGDLVKIKKALHDTHEQILFLAAMINDLSTLSRAERGKLVAEVEQINIHDLVTDLVNSYSKDATKKGLTLHSHIDPHLELLSSSQLYVREILQNFITNAIKYTEQGSVTISAKPHEQGVQFSIADTGIGISHADQEKIFDKFFRSEDYRTRQHNGTGLGLYVTLKLARIIHAEIDVISKLNKGSTFTIFVPNLQEAAKNHP